MKPCEAREDVDLAPQFIGDDRRLGQYRRNYRNAYAATLDCLEEDVISDVPLADLGCLRAVPIAPA